MKKGCFITFEGGEGTGKTTHVRRIAEWFREKKRPLLVTREPGGTPLADKIRAMLLDPKSKGMSIYIELLLYLAGRRDHVKNVILPALRKGMVVLCDRFTDATLAYQGFARGLPVPLLKRLNEAVCEGVKPDLTILFDVPTSVGLQRARKRNKKVTKNLTNEGRFEKEKNLFHEKVRRGYLTLARREKRRFRIIDTRRPKAEVFEKLVSILKTAL
ncbi:MAG: dTMP kinase [Deltaproteobacteria bacterium]|nr:dTMP kinase [Deltaproteobacteria bacterium]MBI4374407.1 dTMP kinase [Deltaproteobacteria bacterium]